VSEEEQRILFDELKAFHSAACAVVDEMRNYLWIVGEGNWLDEPYKLERAPKLSKASMDEALEAMRKALAALDVLQEET